MSEWGPGGIRGGAGDPNSERTPGGGESGLFPADDGFGMARVHVVGRSPSTEVRMAIETILDSGRSHGYELRVEDRLAEVAPAGVELVAGLDGSVPPDLMVTLGGDGTFLRGARLVAGLDVPVLGINLGQMGFLTAAAPEELVEVMRRMVERRFLLDRRMTLEARVTGPGGDVGDPDLALNDVSVHKSGVARVTSLELLVGRGDEMEEVGSFSGDGLIVATPTGSTAYSLSAGGPIIVPWVDCLLVTPISPHTLAVRPLVLPANELLTVRDLRREGDLAITVDGQVWHTLQPGQHVTFRRGDVRIPLVRFPGQTFFSTLRTKLNWAI